MRGRGSHPKKSSGRRMLLATLDNGVLVRGTLKGSYGDEIKRSV